MVWEAQSSWWLIPIWVALYTLDNYLTVYAAGLYEAQSPRVIEFEGGFELTPRFKDEIARRVLFGPRFLRAGLATTAILVLVRWLVHIGWSPSWFFAAAMGFTVLPSCVVNLRHLQNLSFFREILSGSGPRGAIFYPQAMIYRHSASEFRAFALFLILLGLLGNFSFFVGGGVSCIAIGLQHARLARTTNSTGSKA